MKNCEFCDKPTAGVMKLIRWNKTQTEVDICSHCSKLFQRLIAIAGIR